MKKSFDKHPSLFAAAAAVALIGAASLATAAPLSDGTTAATSTAATSAGTPVKTLQAPFPGAVGANPGDIARAQMQAEAAPPPRLPEGVTEWIESGKSGESKAATAPAPKEAPRYGREGFDPSLAELQATPQPLPGAS